METVFDCFHALIIESYKADDYADAILVIYPNTNYWCKFQKPITVNNHEYS